MVRQRTEQTSASLGVDPTTLKTSAGADRPKVAAAAPPPGHPPMSTPAASSAAAPPPGHPAMPPAAAAPAPASTAAPAAGSAPDPQKVREAQQALAGASPQDRQGMINAMGERLGGRAGGGGPRG